VRAALGNEVFAELREGGYASTTDDVERALGRPPRDFAVFAAAAAADGAWSTAAIPPDRGAEESPL
jgi:hypothetical protein